ncbi:MAG: adenine phosphoribosyltransferase [Rhodospirillaceae bacterium]|nr:MAG: adenine phosphoribosyltransferase [Rhodospirillaceae bacterium]
MNLKEYIRGVPDFPIPGILFYDISTLLSHADAWQVAMGRMARMVSVYQPDVLVGIEARGFLVAAPLALKLGCGFVMARKPGKLPGATVSHEYELEYGTDTLQLLEDSIHPGQRVVILDDLLATGGTLKASIDLCKKVGGNVVGAATIIELNFLNGRDKLDVPFESLIDYDE